MTHDAQTKGKMGWLLDDILIDYLSCGLKKNLVNVSARKMTSSTVNKKVIIHPDTADSQIPSQKYSAVIKISSQRVSHLI